MEAGTNEARSQEEEAARFLALRWDLEYRQAHALSLDPSAIGIIDPVEARRLEALPVQMGVSGPIFVVAEPSAERFDAVRALAGEDASFVVVAGSTLEALMNSKVFNPGATPHPQRRKTDKPKVDVEASREASVTPASMRVPDPQEARRPERPPESLTAPEPLRDQDPARRADTAPQVPSNREAAPAQQPASRIEQPTQPPRPPSRDDPGQRPALVAVDRNTVSNEPMELLDSLLSQISASSGALTAQVKDLNEALEANQRELREAKEQLAEAHSENDRYRAMIESLRDEVATSRALTDTTTARLRDVVRSLEAPTLNEALSSKRDEEQTPPREANTRIA